MIEQTRHASREVFMGQDPMKMVTQLKIRPDHAASYARAVRLILRNMTFVKARSASEPFTVKEFLTALVDYRAAYTVWQETIKGAPAIFHMRSHSTMILAPVLIIMRYQPEMARKFFRDAILRDGIQRDGLQDRLADLLISGRGKSREDMERATIQVISYWNAFYIGRERAYQTDRYEDGFIIYGTPFVPQNFRVMHKGVYVDLQPAP